MGFLRSLLSSRRGKRPGTPSGRPPDEDIPSAIPLPQGSPQRGRTLPNMTPEQVAETRLRSGPWRKNRAFRGMAFGLYDPAKRDTSQANKEHWTFIPDRWAEEFVYGNQPFHVHSTNVEYFQYWIKSQELFVQFLSGGSGTYSDVTEGEAIECTQVASKGTWVIDVLIGRENLEGHACWHGGPSRKPYRSGYKPAEVPTIPQAEITPLEPFPQVPESEVSIVEDRFKLPEAAAEDLAKDAQRRAGKWQPTQPWDDLEAQRRAQAEFNRRLLGG